MTDPLDAQKRARIVAHNIRADSSDSWKQARIAEQIRQAEQAARKKALVDVEEMLARLGCCYHSGRDLIAHTRALSEET